MLLCLRKLLDADQGPKRVEFSDSPPDTKETLTNIANLLGSMLVKGRILVHLDEHKRMHKNANFRRGAMGLLARVRGVVVVATYTEPPMEINPSASSDVCRFPVPVPLLDIRAVMEKVDQLSFPVDPSKFNATNQRLWATLLFRLGARVSTKLNFFHLGDNSDFTQFKINFQNEASNAASDSTDDVASKVLKGCINLCRYEARTPSLLPNGCDVDALLLGLTEEALDRIEAKISAGLVAIPGENDSILFTASLRALALHRPAAEDREEVGGSKSVCWDGARRFKLHLTTADGLASSPLECAYVWTIATLSAREGTLEISQDVSVPAFCIVCKEIMGGRLFHSQENSSFDINLAKGLSENTIYFADETKRGQSSHPFGDIFFRTKRNELVLFDVTGSVRDSLFQKKGQRLAEWTKNAKEEAICNAENENLSFYGVVLAPLLSGRSEVNKESDNMFMVLGSDARRLLGGLVQFLAWFPSDV